MRKLKNMMLAGLLFWAGSAGAQSLPSLHVEGRNLVDTHGNTVVLHGVMDTPSPYFNNNRWGNSATDANRKNCIEYFDKLFTALTDTTQGAYCTVFRLHLDPCWTNDPNIPSTGPETGEANISQFSERRLQIYLNTLYCEIIDRALSHGLYVIVRPPGVCPGGIKVGGYYQDYLMTVWDLVSKNERIKEWSGQVSLELANEPVNVYDEDSLSNPRALHDFFQPIVDKIRSNGFDGIIWVPGRGWQGNYEDYKDNPITGYNIGYAVHAYVGWYNCSDETATPERFIEEFGKSVPVIETNPIMVTEVDWSPEVPGEGHYNEHGEWVPGNMGTWATGTTSGWGNAFKAMKDHFGNVGMTLTGTGDYMDIDHYLETGEVVPAFGGEPEACAQACFDWYKDYYWQNYPRPDFTNVSTNQTEDGTKFINPVIAADFPDIDVIRVDDTYYMLSTTMYLMPGATLLKSKDLVNWEYCANPLEQLSTSDKYSLINGQESYGSGMWASALGYHEGKFYILINGNDAGCFLLTTDDPEGKWEARKLPRGYYDPGMLFDNGKVYVACGIGNINVCELDENFNFIKETTVLRDKSGLEGCRFYKIGDYYYIYATYGGWPSGQAIFRSKNVDGPYEEKMLIEKTINGQANTVHQGALVQTQTGEWWTMLMEDKGAIGRLPSLHPVTWGADGWPTVANNGVPQLVYDKPNVGTTHAEKILPTNDNFRSYPLGMQWQWNHNPDNGKWTLFERPGFLRLYTASVTDDVMFARNTLTQRIFGFHNLEAPYGLATGKTAIGTIKLHVGHMQEGDMAGLMIQQDPNAYIAVQVKDGKKVLVWRQDTLDYVSNFVPRTTTESSLQIDSVVYLRGHFDYINGQASFSYSLDNKTFRRLGGVTQMSFNLSVFVGARFGIFNFATEELGGYVDVDWFTTEDDFTEDSFYDPDFEGFNEDMLTAESLTLEDTDVEVLIGTGNEIELTATFRDGHTENVAQMAKYEFTNPEVAEVSSGLVRGLVQGRTDVKATYTDPMGNVFSVTFTVNSTFFPWGDEFITKNLFGEGTYVEDKRAFFPSQYGQMGWKYSNGADMSGYKYLVLKLDRQQNVGAALNLYPEDNIWGNCYSQSIGSNTTMVIPLQEITYTSGDRKGQPVDVSCIRIVALWGNGSGVIDLADMYLTNNEDYTNDAVSVSSVTAKVAEPDGAVYNLQGIRMADTTNLPKGIYIKNGKKFIVK